MKRKLLLVILILLIILLAIIFVIMSAIKKETKLNSISQEKLAEIQTDLKQTSFLNCVYNSPEEIDLYYILLSCKEEEDKTDKDDAEYVYLSYLNSENYSLNAMYPTIMRQPNLTQSQKKALIIQQIMNDLKEQGISSNSKEMQITEDDDSLGVAALSYKKISYNTAKNIIIDNVDLTEEKIIESLENLKTSTKLYYSDTNNCFYMGTASKNVNAYDYNLKCIDGTHNGNMYTIHYTLEFQNAIKENVEFETSFYENDGFKFISNKCILTEEMKNKAKEFENSILSLKTVTDDNGVTYGYTSSDSNKGVEYYIQGGTKTAYYKLCFIKNNTNYYYFTDDIYFYLNETENKNIFLNCYPRQLLTYEFSMLNDNFARAILNTDL